MFSLKSLCSEFIRCTRVWRNYLGSICIYFGICFLEVLGFLMQCLNCVVCVSGYTNGCISNVFSRQRITARAKVREAGQRKSYFLRFFLSRLSLVNCLPTAYCSCTPFLFSRTVTDTLEFKSLQETTIIFFYLILVSRSCTAADQHFSDCCTDQLKFLLPYCFQPEFD